MTRISLRDARRHNDLSQFIDEQELLVVDPVSKTGFTDAIKAIVKAPQQQDQTSGSRAHGGLTGKKTR
jgi:hypothetical protein